MKKSLVILTTSFGTNFSGGSLATCRIFEPIQDEFTQVIAVCHKVGQHNFKSFKHLPFKNLGEGLRKLKSLKKRDDVIFYGDFYLAYYYILLNIPFFFTYHDNWPEQRQLNLSAFFKSFFYIPVYKLIFKNAMAVIHVSNYKLDLYSHFNKNSFLIRNGINAKQTKLNYQIQKDPAQFNLAMIGNIDDRKFGLAPQLFQLLKLKQATLPPFKVAIYGHVSDHKLEEQLRKFDFISIKGFKSSLSFETIDLLVSTSRMENLSIAVCDALKNFTPVICFDVGGLNEVIIEDQTGKLIPKFDVKQMADSITEIITGKFNFNFENQNLQEFDWKLASQKYLKVINDHCI